MNKIDKIKAELEQFSVSSMETLEQFRLQFLTKKSELQELLSEIKNVAPEERKSFGQQVNELKQKAQQLYEEAKAKMEFQAVQAGSDLDVTRPSTAITLGSMHPISIIMNEVCDIFENIGFSTVSGIRLATCRILSSLNCIPTFCCVPIRPHCRCAPWKSNNLPSV